MDCLKTLEKHSQDLLDQFEQSETYRRFFSSNATPEEVILRVRRLLYEVGSYGPWVTTATFTAIGRLSRMQPDIASLTSHVMLEVPHPGFAMQGFLELGGSKEEAQAGLLSPAGYALASVCRMIAEEEHPASFLGYIYLFESTTAKLSERVQAYLDAAKRRVPFVETHVTEDIEHTKHWAQDICSIVTSLPEAAPAILTAFENFKAVYPVPIWESAMTAAIKELKQ